MNPADYLRPNPTLRRNPLLRITINRDATLQARQKYDGRAIVATFDDPTTLYRVMDGEELVLAATLTGEIAGGMFAIPGERMHGASWASTPYDLVQWARGWDRFGKDLFLARFDAQGYTFYHVQPKSVSVDPNGPPEQDALFDSEECSTGLGCSVRVPVGSVSFAKVLPDGSLQPMSWPQVEAYAKKKPTKDVNLRPLGGDHVWGGTIFGTTVLVIQDQEDKLWGVKTRDGKFFIMGAKTRAKAVKEASDILMFGQVPPVVLFLNRRPIQMELAKPGQVWADNRRERVQIEKVGATYISGKWLGRPPMQNQYATIYDKEFARYYHQESP